MSLPYLDKLIAVVVASVDGTMIKDAEELKIMMSCCQLFAHSYMSIAHKMSKDKYV